MGQPKIDKRRLTIFAGANPGALRALCAPVRFDILRLLHDVGPLNVNQISHALSLPQSTVVTGIRTLEAAGLIETRLEKSRGAYQKICSALYDEILLSFEESAPAHNNDIIEIAMPIGLYTSYVIHAPCGICSKDGLIGRTDFPHSFFDPKRVQAGFLWFARGHLEYAFPNNAKILNRCVSALEIEIDLCPGVPGNSYNWPSDITISVNGIAVDTWTSPTDPRRKSSARMPAWWKLERPRYAGVGRWRISKEGTSRNGIVTSSTTIDDFAIGLHSAIGLRIGTAESAQPTSGINIFGRGFSDFGGDILMRIELG